MKYIAMAPVQTDIQMMMISLPDSMPIMDGSLCYESAMADINCFARHRRMSYRFSGRTLIRAKITILYVLTVSHHL